jgi:hypothetical protein
MATISGTAANPATTVSNLGNAYQSQTTLVSYPIQSTGPPPAPTTGQLWPRAY